MKRPPNRQVGSGASRAWSKWARWHLLRRWLANDYILGAVAVGVVWYPIFWAQHDMWDGATLSFAGATGETLGLRVWFGEAGIPQHLGYSLALAHLSTWTEVPYFALSAAIAATAHLILVRETRLFLVDSGSVNLQMVRAGTLLAALTPLGWLFHSSILHIYLVCIAAGIVGARLVVQRRSALLYGPVLFFSFGLSSMLLLVPTLVAAREGLLMGRPLSKGTAWSLSLALSTYFVMRIGFAPRGLYDGYNALLLPKSGSDVTRLLALALDATASLLPLALLLCALVLLGRSAPRTHGGNQVRPVLVAVLLLAAAVIPYALVGKSSNIFETQQWSARHAMPLVAVLPLIVVLMVGPLHARLSGQRWKAAVAIGGVYTIAVLHAALFIGGSETIRSRQVFDDALRQIIAVNADWVPPGRVFIFGSGIPGPLIDPPEVNRMFFDATGRLDWYAVVERKSQRTTTVVTEADRVPIVWADPRHGLKYLYVPPAGPQCSTVWHIDVVASHRQWWPRPLGPDSTIRLLSSDTAC